MSYTTHFKEKVSGEVKFRFTVTKNTALGDHTETVKYEQDVYIDITVDTDPFDRSIDGCATSVNHLTGSVTAAGAAEVTSRLTSADKVGQSITSGFFGLVEQNFRMQAVEEQAQLNAVSGELMEQAKELNHKKEVMSGDYHRIKSRYTDLFLDLDNELRNRIVNLLKPCFHFVESSAEELNRNIRTSLLATSMVAHKENMGLQARLSTARMKERTIKLIDSSKRFLMGQKWLERQIDEMLVNETAKGMIFIPIIAVQKRGEENSAVLDLVINKEARSFGIEENNLRLAIGRHSSLDRKIDSAHRSHISDNFNMRVSQAYGSSEHEKRVASVMKSLYEKTEF